MHERTLDYLQRMHDLCVDIKNFIDGIELEDFLQDKRTQGFDK